VIECGVWWMCGLGSRVGESGGSCGGSGREACDFAQRNVDQWTAPSTSVCAVPLLRRGGISSSHVTHSYHCDPFHAFSDDESEEEVEDESDSEAGPVSGSLKDRIKLLTEYVSLHLCGSVPFGVECGLCAVLNCVCSECVKRLGEPLFRSIKHALEEMADRPEFEDKERREQELKALLKRDKLDACWEKVDELVFTERTLNA
jgi:hypothetical protein